MPGWIEEALAARPKAPAFFRSLAPGYRRNYARFLVEAEQEATRRRRLRRALDGLEAGRKQVV